MAEQYGIRAEKALASRIKGNPVTSIRNSELNQNIINNYTYNELNFYTGNFKAVKQYQKSKRFFGVEQLFCRGRNLPVSFILI